MSPPTGGVTWLSEETNVFRLARTRNGQYIWTQDLVGLQRPKGFHFNVLKKVAEAQFTFPLQSKVDWWVAGLESHPDRLFVAYIVEGLLHGFRTGFVDEDRRIINHQRGQVDNLPATKDHKDVVDAYLQKECHLGRVMEVKVEPSWGEIHVSPIGVIPKKTAGKWRLIVDLSSPKGHSINDGISEELASLAYVSVDNIKPGFHLCLKGA